MLEADKGRFWWGNARYGQAFPWMDYRSQVIPWTPLNTPLQHAKVVFVTTAGLHRRADPPFETQDEERGDPSYRVIPTAAAGESLGVKHHLGLVGPGENGDTNHLLPLHVGRQLMHEGVIGALSAEHYSFMGYIPHAQPLLERTAPEVARRLDAEQVDAVILIPVWPLCNQSVGLIARAIEQAGISTVCFNLLLATPSQLVRPPRTIWLPFFPFSLPLGLPGNVALQHRLVLDALQMLSTCQTPGTVLRLSYTVWGSNQGAPWLLLRRMRFQCGDEP